MKYNMFINSKCFIYYFINIVYKIYYVLCIKYIFISFDEIYYKYIYCFSLRVSYDSQTLYKIYATKYWTFANITQNSK